MDAIERELQFRRSLMQQQIMFQESRCQQLLPMPTSLFELQLMQRPESVVAQSLDPFFLGSMHSRPLDPTTALLAQSQRLNEYTIMRMEELKARKLLQPPTVPVFQVPPFSRNLGPMSLHAAPISRHIPAAAAAISEPRPRYTKPQNNLEEARLRHAVSQSHPKDDNKAGQALSSELTRDDSDSSSNYSSGRINRKRKKKDAKWHEMLEELTEYKKRFGDCIVPRGYSQNPRLASWVAEQRKQYRLLNSGKSSSITRERVTLLNKIDFAWNAQEAAWDRHIDDLRRFRTEYGHCHVPLGHPDYPKLGLWVKEQRRHYNLMKQGKTAHMSAHRAAVLDGLGFCWDTHEATWLERLGELIEFKAKFGTCLVPTNYPEKPKLGTWVHHQRRQFKLFREGKPSHITQERIQTLERLGFVWSPRGRAYQGSSTTDGSSTSENDEALDSRPQKRLKS